MTDTEFLEALKAYIEESEHTIECEWGSMRSTQELIAAGEMPTIYNEVLARIALRQ